MGHSDCRLPELYIFVYSKKVIQYVRSHANGQPLKGRRGRPTQRGKNLYEDHQGDNDHQNVRVALIRRVNARLRLALQNAKGANMPKDNIDRAIKKASELMRKRIIK
jgi:hypothetical protein